MPTDNLRITRTHPLISPAVLEEELPLGDGAGERVAAARRTIAAIFRGDDRRLLVVVGPCSVHDPAAALDYAGRLGELQQEIAGQIFCVMRVYFEKPRTVMGWKGLINDPGLDGTYQINRGLRLARKLLIDVTDAGLPAGTEFLDTTFGQYYTDLVSWGAIGARTVESQIHRELASGLSMPVGIKNRTDGNVQVAVDAIRAASQRHLFPSLTKEGAPAILETSGNPDCHLVLRGGDRPNYDSDAVQAAQGLLAAAGLRDSLMVDCSHANSGKDPEQQPAVARSVCRQRAAGNDGLKALMLESHLVGGRQDIASELRYGQSITDPCLAFDDTRSLLLELAEALSR
ncbi:MAG: 3-deoxy-7-phosphoheptulonate synthase [Gammaproteobacteria bacterium]|nr:3-deoxy-7-phosphoheptulonate synthase [Gammaproteobacteria bacterium]